MCIALPVRVISVDGAKALVDDGARARTVGCALAPAARPGDWALLTAGQLVAVIPAEEAREVQALLGELREEVQAWTG